MVEDRVVDEGHRAALPQPENEVDVLEPVVEGPRRSPTASKSARRQAGTPRRAGRRCPGSSCSRSGSASGTRQRGCPARAAPGRRAVRSASSGRKPRTPACAGRCRRRRQGRPRRHGRDGHRGRRRGRERARARKGVAVQEKDVAGSSLAGPRCAEPARVGLVTEDGCPGAVRRSQRPSRPSSRCRRRSGEPGAVVARGSTDATHRNVSSRVSAVTTTTSSDGTPLTFAADRPRRSRR